MKRKLDPETEKRIASNMIVKDEVASEADQEEMADEDEDEVDDEEEGEVATKK